MTRAEQEESVRLLRFLSQKTQHYAVSHGGASVHTALRKMHDTLLLADALSETEEFLKLFNAEHGWRGFIHRLMKPNG